MDEKDKDDLALLLVMVAVTLSPLWLIFPFTYFVLGWK